MSTPEVPHRIPHIDLSYAFGDDNPYSSSDVNISETNLMMPERRLWITVIILGIRGVLHGDVDDTNWFNSPDGFDWACSLIGLNPEPIRKRVLSLNSRTIDPKIPQKFPQYWQDHPIRKHRR